MLFLWASRLTIDGFTTCLVILWFIWYNRNQDNHEGNAISPDVAVLHIKSLLKRYGKSFSHSLFSISSQLAVFLWQPPKGTIKINVDGTRSEPCQKCGLRCVVRDGEATIQAVRWIMNDNMESAFNGRRCSNYNRFAACSGAGSIKDCSGD